MGVEYIADIATGAGVLISLAALLKAVYEYSLQGKQKRAEYLFSMRDRCFANKDFNSIEKALSDENEEKIKTFSRQQKETYLGFIEEVAILETSGMISANAAYYMFGYYAKSCWHSDSFWSDIDRNDKYWSVFKKFAERVIAKENHDFVRPEKLQF